MGEFTKRAGDRGRRHGAPPPGGLAVVQRVVLSGDSGARTADAPAGHSPHYQVAPSSHSLAALARGAT